MAIFAEVTENEYIIDRHLHDIQGGPKERGHFKQCITPVYNDVGRRSTTLCFVRAYIDTSRLYSVSDRQQNETYTMDWNQATERQSKQWDLPAKLDATAVSVAGCCLVVTWASKTACRCLYTSTKYDIASLGASNSNLGKVKAHIWQRSSTFIARPWYVSCVLYSIY